MRLRIEPQPTPQEAEAIATAIATLLARSGPAAKELRFNDAGFVRTEYSDIPRAGLSGCRDTYRRDYSWQAVARIEALTPGV